MSVEKKIELNVKNISAEIEKMKSQSGLNYIESTIEVCTQHGIEPESMKSILPKAIKEKIEADASELNMLKYKINTISQYNVIIETLTMEKMMTGVEVYAVFMTIVALCEILT